MPFGLLFFGKDFLELIAHIGLGDTIVEIILKLYPFLFRIVENDGQQNIPLDGDISFSFDELVDLGNLLSDHSRKYLLRQSSFGELLLEQLSWMLDFHVFLFFEINNCTILRNSEFFYFISLSTINNFYLFYETVNCLFFKLHLEFNTLFTYSTKQ